MHSKRRGDAPAPLKAFQALSLFVLVSVCALPITSCLRGRKGDSGSPGSQGAQGVAGKDGSAGAGCQVSQIPVGDSVLPRGGAVVICEDGTSAVISNGAQGEQGEKGDTGAQGEQGPSGSASALAIVAKVDPCGTAPGIYNEILLKLGDGSLVCLFADNSNGKNPRLSQLTAGCYTTTDGDSCTFCVDSTGSLTYESHKY